MSKFSTLGLAGILVTLSLALCPIPADARLAVPGAGSSGPGIGGAAFTPKVWAACGRTSADDKIVRTYDRYRASAGGHFLKGGKSNLLCGNTSVGYRHILLRHRTEWEQEAVLTSNNWRDVTDFAIATILSDPDKVTYQPRNRVFCFSRVIYLINKRTKHLVETKIPKVVVSETNQQVVTAYPTNTQCGS